MFKCSAPGECIIVRNKDATTNIDDFKYLATKCWSQNAENRAIDNLDTNEAHRLIFEYNKKITKQQDKLDTKLDVKNKEIQKKNAKLLIPNTQPSEYVKKKQITNLRITNDRELDLYGTPYNIIVKHVHT